MDSVANRLHRCARPSANRTSPPKQNDRRNRRLRLPDRRYLSGRFRSQVLCRWSAPLSLRNEGHSGKFARERNTSMSLTQAETIFASIHENGLNDLVATFFTARPRHLVYGSSLFVPATTAMATNVPTLPLPGIPGGLHYGLVFTIPVIDLHPDSSGGSSPLPSGPGEFSLRTQVSLVIACGRLRDPRQDDQTGLVPLVTHLELHATGRPTIATFGPGAGVIGLEITRVEIVDIKPDSLETILECLLLQILRSALANLQLPFQAFTVGFVQLLLVAGPIIEEDQIKLRGLIA